METRARAEFADRATASMTVLAVCSQLAEVLAKPISELSAGEQIQRRVFFLRVMKNLRFLFLESNDISELPIVGWGDAFKDSYNLQMWEVDKPSFNQGFVDFVKTELINR